MLKSDPGTEPLWFADQWIDATFSTRAEFAKATGYSDSQISEWATGRTRFNGDVVKRFAKALKIHPSMLFIPVTQANDTLAKVVAGLEGAQRERALKILIAADLAPTDEEAA